MKYLLSNGMMQSVKYRAMIYTPKYSNFCWYIPNVEFDNTKSAGKAMYVLYVNCVWLLLVVI